MTPFAEATVAAKFDAYPEPLRTRLLELRELIFATAAADATIGPLTETLKWNQPAYRPVHPNRGTTIRLDALPDRPDHVGLFVHCQTRLIATFRAQLTGSLHYEGNRAIHVAVQKPLPETALRTCIAMAFSYHLRKHPAASRPIGERIRRGR